MGTHGESKQRLSSVAAVGASRQRGRDGLGETPDEVCQAVAELVRRWKASSASFVAIYLVSIVTANLITTTFGPAASVFNSFALIALDLTARDRLHDAWHHSRLVLKMAVLIAFGSTLSWLLNASAGPIALASFVAFSCAAVADTLIYQLLYRRAWLWRANGSNLVSAAVDSLVFPTLAFGGVLWPITLGQFAAKVVGGIIWSVILRRRSCKNSDQIS